MSYSHQVTATIPGHFGWSVCTPKIARYTGGDVVWTGHWASASWRSVSWTRLRCIGKTVWLAGWCCFGVWSWITNNRKRYDGSGCGGHYCWFWRSDVRWCGWSENYTKGVYNSTTNINSMPMCINAPTLISIKMPYGDRWPQFKQHVLMILNI